MLIEETLIEKVLEPYKREVRYLTTASINNESKKITGLGQFCIQTPWYIQDTNHLNAVDLFICYNQLVYSMFAKGINERLIKEFDNFDITDFFNYQLKHSLIISCNNIKFRKPIKTDNFKGEIDIHKISKMGSKGLYVIQTNYTFEDSKATGNINLGILT